MKKILQWFGNGLITEIGKVVDSLFTSDEERIKAKNEIFKVLKDQQLELQRLQSEVIIAEAKGNWLQRSWRPILMLAFGFIVIYVKFIAPLFSLPIPPLEDEFWNLLQIGIGGYVIGRTGEKMIKEYASTKK
tara:strand:- start:8620 stop:9015 length:396 start_codon:yes stop_codon:yes gene_type:complete